MIWSEQLSAQPFDAWVFIKAAIKAQHETHLLSLHDSQVDCVPGRKPSHAENNLLRPLYDFAVDGIHLIDNSEERVERRLDCIKPTYCSVAVKNFLKHLRIGYQTLSFRDQTFNQALGVHLVRMRRADKIHWHIGIDENHGRLPLE